MSLLTAHGADATPARRSPWASGWLWLTVLSSAGAGVLHVAAAVGHRQSGQLVVGAFLAVALAQCVGGWLLAVSSLSRRRPDPWALTAALAGTLALVVLYVLAHTTDLLAGLTGHGLAAAGGHDAAGGHGAAGGHDAEHAAAGEPQGHSVVPEGPVALSAEAEAGTPPGLLGTATVALELLCALGLTALLPRTWRGWALDVQLALGALGWVLWLTGVLG